MKILGSLFKPATACAWCEKEARQKGVKLEYNPDEVSHGICADHKVEQVSLIEALKIATMER